MAINEYVALNMLTFCRHSNLSSGSAFPAAPGSAEVVVKLLRMLPPLQPLFRAGWSILHRTGDRAGEVRHRHHIHA